MTIRHFAFVFGIVFLLVGLAGFIPALSTYHPEMGHSMLLGLFPVNPLHNIVHLLFGAWGLWAYATFERSHTYAVGIAIAYGLFVIVGLIPGLNTLYGLIPLYGHDVWLHGVIALIAAYFAWGRRVAHV